MATNYVQIPNLPPGVTPTTGTEQIEVVQGGVSVRLSLSQIAAYIVSLGLGVTGPTGPKGATGATGPTGP